MKKRKPLGLTLEQMLESVRTGRALRVIVGPVAPRVIGGVDSDDLRFWKRVHAGKHLPVQGRAGPRLELLYFGPCLFCGDQAVALGSSGCK